MQFVLFHYFFLTFTICAVQKVDFFFFSVTQKCSSLNWNEQQQKEFLDDWGDSNVTVLLSEHCALFSAICPCPVICVNACRRLKVIFNLSTLNVFLSLSSSTPRRVHERRQRRGAEWNIDLRLYMNQYRNYRINPADKFCNSVIRHVFSNHVSLKAFFPLNICTKSSLEPKNSHSHMNAPHKTSMMEEKNIDKIITNKIILY